MTAPAGVLLDRENPWPGLLAFPESAEALFNGREVERDELLRLVRREMLTLLYGQSGLGKTSLLMAGLFPALRRENFLPVYVRIDHAASALPPVDQMLALLRTACAEQGVTPPPPMPGEGLWEYLHRKGEGFWSDRNHPVTPVFVLDQFEEILTLGREDPGRAARSAAFLQDLGDLVNNSTPATLAARLAAHPDEAGRYAFRQAGYRIVIGAREDFVPELEQHLRPVTSSLMQNSLRLTRMSGRQGYDAILRAGHARGQDGRPDLVAPEVAERIIQFLAGVPVTEGVSEPPALERLAVEPALLSVFCRELNEKRQRDGKAVIEIGLMAASKEAILSEFYERSTADLGPAVRRLIEDDLLTGSGHRDSRALDDILRRPGISREAIDALIARRLLRLEDRFGVKRVELTHDVLTGIVRESRDRRRLVEESERQQAAREIERREATQRNRRRRAQLLALIAVGVVVWAVAAYTTRRANRAIAEANRAVAAAQDSARVLVAEAAEQVRRAHAEREIIAEVSRENVRMARENERLADSLGQVFRRRFPPVKVGTLADLGITPGRIPDTLPVLRFMETVAGTIVGEGSYHAVLRFEGEAEQSVSFRLRSDEFDSQLTVFDGRDGRLMATDDDSWDGLNSKIWITLPAKTTYVVVASSTSGRSVGPYQLSTDSVDVEPESDVPVQDMPEIANLADLSLHPDSLPSDLPMLLPDSVVRGVLGEGATRSVGDRRYAAWKFAGQQGDSAVFGLRSSEFDAYLYLFDAATGALLRQDDDGWTATNAMIQSVLPRTGSYLVVATSYSAGSSGSFTLRHSRTVLPMGETDGESTLERFGLSFEQLVAGAMSVELGAVVEDSLAVGQDARPWTLQAAAGTRLSIQVDAETLDPAVILYHVESGRLIAEDDDGGEGLNALIRTTLAEPGQYLLVVHAVGEPRGTYTLRLRRW